ncbi:hypothetical protein CHUAL_009253 [Chamberlinius hualienensis]
MNIKVNYKESRQYPTSYKPYKESRQYPTFYKPYKEVGLKTMYIRPKTKSIETAMKLSFIIMVFAWTIVNSCLTERKRPFNFLIPNSYQPDWRRCEFRVIHIPRRICRYLAVERQFNPNCCGYNLPLRCPKQRECGPGNLRYCCSYPAISPCCKDACCCDMCSFNINWNMPFTFQICTTIRIYKNNLLVLLFITLLAKILKNNYQILYKNKLRNLVKCSTVDVKLNF